MIGKLILKLKGKDWKTATSRIFDVEVSFDDLLSQADYGLQNLRFEALDITTPLESYIGKENVPDKDILKELFGKVATNSFGFFCGKYPFGNDFENICVNYHPFMQIVGGSALFLGVSKLDHSCVPNAFYHATGASITVRAIRTIKKFEKVTIGYTNMVLAPLKHEFTTKLKFREKCYCSDCSQVPGESKLTKILDASKAFGVLQETEKALQLSSMLPINYLNPTVTRGYLKNLLKRQDGALGRTHLHRMQTLAKLYSPEQPELSKEEMRAGIVELTESMKEVWGDYHPEWLCITGGL
ncbi:hypothetical protein JTE90_021997 [Oedothorax gibbosus]|uniref:SET domain-containing protein n=1 Tax=Oedothorax gibbosus TaxID=931172 RepID=A0AAV6TR54_9ARAC|nr:hypothetical protein JTE90_021997 [Oedothorax gibbosus]